MKCPHCNADMVTHAFNAHGFPLTFDLILNHPVNPATWQLECPNCRFSGPRQLTKEAAKAAVRCLTGPFSLAAIANGVKSAIGTHGVNANPTSIAKRILGELKREGANGQSQEA